MTKKTLVGVNALGRLLMELRELVKSEPQDNLLCVERPSIPYLLLDGRPVQRIVAGRVGAGRRKEAVPPVGAAGLRHVDSSASLPLLEPAMPVGSSPVRPNSREYGMAEDRTSWRPYAAYKDSGVEWLGEVPAHWEVLRLKAWLDVNQMVLPEDTDPDYTFDYVDIGSVATGRLSARPERIRFGDSPSRARRVVRLWRHARFDSKDLSEGGVARGTLPCRSDRVNWFRSIDAATRHVPEVHRATSSRVIRSPNALRLSQWESLIRQLPRRG